MGTSPGTQGLVVPAPWQSPKAGGRAASSPPNTSLSNTVLGRGTWGLALGPTAGAGWVWWLVTSCVGMPEDEFGPSQHWGTSPVPGFFPKALHLLQRCCSKPLGPAVATAPYTFSTYNIKIHSHYIQKSPRPVLYRAAPRELCRFT